jgi:hypothetical protein
LLCQLRARTRSCPLGLHSNLAESGLGYANLLYIATVVMELQSAREAELTLCSSRGPRWKNAQP